MRKFTEEEEKVKNNVTKVTKTKDKNLILICHTHQINDLFEPLSINKNKKRNEILRVKTN